MHYLTKYWKLNQSFFKYFESFAVTNITSSKIKIEKIEIKIIYFLKL